MPFSSSLFDCIPTRRDKEKIRRERIKGKTRANQTHYQDSQELKTNTAPLFKVSSSTVAWSLNAIVDEMCPLEGERRNYQSFTPYLPSVNDSVKMKIDR